MNAPRNCRSCGSGVKYPCLAAGNRPALLFGLDDASQAGGRKFRFDGSLPNEEES